jgi:hypothetical protein
VIAAAHRADPFLEEFGHAIAKTRAGVWFPACDSENRASDPTRQKRAALTPVTGKLMPVTGKSLPVCRNYRLQ